MVRCAASHRVVQAILQADQLHEGDRRYVVPAKWLIGWSYWTQSNPVPGPIDNTSMLDPDLSLLLNKSLRGADTPSLIDQTV